VLFTQGFHIHSFKGLQKVIHNHWNWVLVFKVILDFLFIFQSKERHDNFFNSFFDKNLFEVFFLFNDDRNNL